MKIVKRIIGLLCMVLGPLLVIALVTSAIQNIDLAGTADINKPIPWVIIIFIFTPIAVGLTLFGWYAWKGEYESRPR
jgi:Ni/Fe-hydrogenase subunit HybB-like protein